MLQIAWIPTCLLVSQVKQFSFTSPKQFKGCFFFFIFDSQTDQNIYCIVKVIWKVASISYLCSLILLSVDLHNFTYKVNYI